MTIPLRHLALSIILSLAALAGGAGLFAFLVNLRDAPAARPVLPRVYSVERATLRRGDFEESLPVQGTARALRGSRLAAQVAGEIVWRRPGLEAGVAVAAGEELLRIDPRQFRSEVTRREGAMERAEGNAERARVDEKRLSEQLEIRRRELEIAQGEFARAQELREEAVFSKSQSETRESALKVAESALLRTEWELQQAAIAVKIEDANVSTARAELDLARIDLEHASVRAPFAARVVEVSADLGERVSPGEEVVEIVDVSEVEVPIQLPASEARWVKEGAKVELGSASNDGMLWSGRIARLSPRVSSVNRTLEAYVVVNNETEGSGAALLPGAFATGYCVARRFENVYAVPREYFIDGRMFRLVETNMLEVWLENEIARRSLSGDSAPTRDALIAGLGAHRAELEAEGVMVARALRPPVEAYTNSIAVVREGIDEGAVVVASNIDVMYDGAVVRQGRE